jgi:hypothetical protein
MVTQSVVTKPIEEEKWITLREVRDTLNIGRTKLRYIMQRGEINTRTSKKDMRKVYVNLYEIERYLNEPF